MNSDMSVHSERIDDYPLLLGMWKNLGLAEILDSQIPRHGQQQGLSYGWLATIWLSHILSQGDHRKEPVRAWVE